MKKLAFALALTFSSYASAAPVYNPVGVQKNVLVSTVLAGGWTQCYVGTMAQAIVSNGGQNLVLSACNGDNLMMAGRVTGSNTLLALAAADRADTIFNTGINTSVTHVANGAQWYYAADWSWGFTALGDSVNKNSCDVSSGPASMCLHTRPGSGGYRINDITSLNGSTAYEKIFFVSNDVSAVPEPASIALLGLGAFALMRRRNRK